MEVSMLPDKAERLDNLYTRLDELWREIDAAIAAGDGAATREAEGAWLRVYGEYRDYVKEEAA